LGTDANGLAAKNAAKPDGDGYGGWRMDGGSCNSTGGQYDTVVPGLKLKEALVDSLTTTDSLALTDGDTAQ